MLLIVVCLVRGLASAESDLPQPRPDDEVSTEVNFFSAWSARADPLRKLQAPHRQTFSLNFGPKLFELRALYMEKRQPGEALTNPLADHGSVKLDSYFDLLATASHFGGKLVGEGEIAYSTFGISSFSDPMPIMSRLAVRGRWGKAGYGTFYRSFGPGFMPMAGPVVPYARHEKLLWGEYDFGLFRLRGAVGESWEENPAVHQVTLTRTADTSLRLEQPRWIALLSSNYTATGQGNSANWNSRALTHGLSFTYRPASILKLEPNIRFKQEWDLGNGTRSSTPSAGMALVWSPVRDLQLTCQASYARGLSPDPLKELSTLDAATHLKWKIGKSYLGDQSLSFQLQYKNQFYSNSTPKPPDSFTATVQFIVERF
jgi:hypothetical protein